MLFLEYVLASLLIFVPAALNQAESTAYPGLLTRMPPVDAAPDITPTPELFGIQSPVPGQALQGNVDVLGNVEIDGFEYAEIVFGYSGDPTNTWFLIQHLPEPVAGTVLVTWDTTKITDGTYDLMLVVQRTDGNKMSHTIERLRVRNYTPVETNTPTPVTPTSTPLPGALPTPTTTLTASPQPTPTPLPTNPARLTSKDINQSLERGILAVFGLFTIAGLYLLIKKR